MKIRGVIMKMKEPFVKRRIEAKFEVQTYLDRLNYAIANNSVQINYQKKRIVDERKDERYTNRHTMLTLFPDEDEVEVLKRELTFLTINEYIETVKDIRFQNYSEMRVFGKKYSSEDVYIKIRVELINTTHASGNNFIFIMSFHFAEKAFVDTDFPYKR